MSTTLTPKQEAFLVEQAWKAGILEWKLLPHQDKMYEALWAFIDGEPLTYCINCARRFGKTSVLLIIAIEYCLRFNRSIVRFAMPYQKEARSIIRVFFNKLLEDCPEDIKPAFNAQDSYWKFANGSELHIHGVNNNHEDNLRGHEAHLAFVDEAGQVDQLKYLTSDILLPQLITTGGKLVIASTPSPIPGHHYKTMYDKCKLEKALSEYTIYDNTSLHPKAIEKWCDESGGEESSTWKREYLIQFEVDQDRVIIPEWKDEYIVDLTERPRYFDFYHKYLGMDLGVINDYTAILFGYYNFEDACLCIEAEITSRGSNQTTEFLHGKIVKQEADLGYREMHTRIVDNNNPQLINDMRVTYHCNMRAVQKTTLVGMVNKLRTFIAAGRLKVDPSCEMLIGCLETAWWDTGSSKDKIAGKQPKFGRDETYSHFDHLAALMYLLRAVDQHTNPIPVEAYANDATHYISEEERKPKHTSDSMNNLANALNGR